ncbi:hypothetical protein [Glycocaulis sp.]|uniref:hypothetical protein n=1 Tax=Glycocaulis sp. TaxID=1969725 RepID=UPI0025BE27ED|nr:hypothetical protein [Glycocaulis sp.]MCH8522834.1 hypothetical protein [Glycocaulis sp.]
MNLEFLLKNIWNHLSPRQEEPLGEPVELGVLFTDAISRMGMTVEDVEKKAGFEPGGLKPLIDGSIKLTPELTLQLEPAIGPLAERLYFFQVGRNYYEEHGKWPPSPSAETARAIRKQLGR